MKKHIIQSHLQQSIYSKRHEYIEDIWEMQNLVNILRDDCNKSKASCVIVVSLYEPQESSEYVATHTELKFELFSKIFSQFFRDFQFQSFL